MQPLLHSSLRIAGKNIYNFEAKTIQQTCVYTGANCVNGETTINKRLLARTFRVLVAGGEIILKCPIVVNYFSRDVTDNIAIWIQKMSTSSGVSDSIRTAWKQGIDQVVVVGFSTLTCVDKRSSKVKFQSTMMYGLGAPRYRGHKTEQGKGAER